MDRNPRNPMHDELLAERAPRILAIGNPDGPRTFHDRVRDLELTDRQRAVMASIPGPDPQAQLERDVEAIRATGAEVTVHPPRFDMSKLNDAAPSWDDADLFGTELPARQVRDRTSPGAATRAKARAKRKRRKR